MLWLAAAARWVWGFLAPILTFGITLPAWAFLAAGIWLWWDKTSAVREAVDKAVTELVAGAEIEALEAKVEGERRLRMYAEGNAQEARRRADAAETANTELAARGALDALENERMRDELDDVRASEPACVVGPDLGSRLRNR